MNENIYGTKTTTDIYAQAQRYAGSARGYKKEKQQRRRLKSERSKEEIPMRIINGDHL